MLELMLLRYFSVSEERIPMGDSSWPSRARNVEEASPSYTILLPSSGDDPSHTHSLQSSFSIHFAL